LASRHVFLINSTLSISAVATHNARWLEGEASDAFAVQAAIS